MDKSTDSGWWWVVVQGANLVWGGVGVQTLGDNGRSLLRVYIASRHEQVTQGVITGK